MSSSEKINHLHGIVTHKELLAPYAGFEKEETIAIQFHHRNTKVQGFDKEQAVDLLRSEFLKNYEKYLEIGYLHVSLEQHKETKQGLLRVVCEMKLSGKPGVCSVRERVKMLQRFDGCIFEARRDSLPQSDNGELLSYCAK